MAINQSDEPKPLSFPRLHIQLGVWPALDFDVTGPTGDVSGFSMSGSEPLSQAAADSLVDKLSDFYDSLDYQEQRVLASLMGQAAD